MRNVVRRLMGKEVQLSEKQQARMAKMQARADAMAAEGEAKARQAMQEAAAVSGAGAGVGGPAGARPGGVLGPLAPGEVPQSIPSVRELVKNSVEGFRDVIGEHSDDRAGVIDAGGADFHRPPPEVDDPAERARIAEDERAARLAALEPYVAPGAPEVVVTRFATTGREQLEAVVARLGGFRPDRVFGVYRVADRMDLKRDGEAGAYVEWAVVHATDAAGAQDVPPVLTAFRRDHHWVARRPGEPRVLDEDVAGAFVARAGIDPEACFGVTRLWHVRGRDGIDVARSYRAAVEAVLVLSQASDAVAAARKRMEEEAPLALSPVLPFHVEILDWEAVAAWVRPQRERGVRVPSPLPHLPATPEELLAAYLRIVGVQPADCFGAQVARTSDAGLGDLSAAGLGKLQRAVKQPCEDGKARVRLHAAEHVVVTYRDRAAYQDGRERWRGYQEEVLRARLDHLTGVREPLTVDEHPRQSFLGEVFDFVNPLDPLHAVPQIFKRNDGPTLGPYCGTVER